MRASADRAYLLSNVPVFHENEYEGSRSQHANMQSSKPRLTAKQQRFVRALLEGSGKSAAYRSAYGSGVSGREASVRAYRVATSPNVREVLAQVEKGNFAGLISCGIPADVLIVKKLFTMAEDRTVPSYVQVRALQAALKYQEKSEFRVPEKATSLGDLERLLQAECGEKPNPAASANHATDLRDEFDLNFTLD